VSTIPRFRQICGDAFTTLLLRTTSSKADSNESLRNFPVSLVSVESLNNVDFIFYFLHRNWVAVILTIIMAGVFAVMARFSFGRKLLLDVSLVFVVFVTK
jgi:hypothetical protein